MSKTLRILIVDDNEDDALLMVRQIKRSGYEVISERVDTAQTMKAAMTRVDWDVVLVDYAMPYFSGPDALVVAQEMSHGIPCIVVSGSLGDEIAVTMMRAGAHDYLMKDNLNRLTPAIEREMRDAVVRRKRKEAEAALAESEKRFRSVLETANNAIISADSKGMIIFWNKAAERIFGYTAEEIIGKSLTTIMPQQYHEAHRKGLQRISEGSQSKLWGRPVEFEGLRKDGSIFPIELSVARWTMDSDTFFTGIINDITQRKQTEEAVRDSEARLRSLRDDVLDSSGMGLFILDADFKVVWINRMIEIFFGLQREQVIGKDKRELIRARISDIFEDPQEFMDKVFSTYDNNTYLEQFECHVLGDGSRPERWLEHRSLPILSGFYAGGRMEHYIDITGRKRAEVEREHLLRVLSLKNEELQSIVYVSSHDLKTPLVNIGGFSSMLTQHCEQLEELVERADICDDIRKEITPLIEENIPEDLNYICSGSSRMNTLINGLLRVSRIGTSDLKPEKIDMNRMIAEITKTIKYQTDEADTTITIDRLPDCSGDLSQTNHVFSNLIDNALKYLDPDRKGIIRITGHVADSKSVYCVEDNGIGIDQAYEGKIFEIYHRLEPEGSVAGEGLGLTIVRRALDRNDGEIWLKSEPGIGSKFFVSLPTVKA